MISMKIKNQPSLFRPFRKNPRKAVRPGTPFVICPRARNSGSGVGHRQHPATTYKGKLKRVSWSDNCSFGHIHVVFVTSIGERWYMIQPPLTLATATPSDTHPATRSPRRERDGDGDDDGACLVGWRLCEYDHQPMCTFRPCMPAGCGRAVETGVVARPMV